VRLVLGHRFSWTLGKRAVYKCASLYPGDSIAVFFLFKPLGFYNDISTKHPLRTATLRGLVLPRSSVIAFYSRWESKRCLNKPRWAFINTLCPLPLSKLGYRSGMHSSITFHSPGAPATAVEEARFTLTPDGEVGVIVQVG